MKTNLTSWKTSTKRTKIFIAVLSVITSLIVFWSGWDLFNSTFQSGWIHLGILAILAIAATIALPHLGTIILFGDLYLMSIAVIYGIAPCMVATVFYAVAALCVLKGLSNVMRLFNFCSMVCNSFLFSVAYLLFAANFSSKINNLILPILIMSFVSFLFTLLLTVIILALSHKSKISISLAKKSPLLMFNYFVSAIGATLLIALHPHTTYAGIFIFPLILMEWSWTKIIKERAERVLNP